MHSFRNLVRKNALPLVFTAITTPVMLRLAWIGDDSLITMRTALNAAHGWGFGFNALEQVQGYTHPTWFLSWLILGWATDQWTMSIIALSIALSSFAILMLFRLTSIIAVSIGALCAVLLSNAFIEYTSSGLENPMGYALLIALFTLLRKPPSRDGHWVLMGILVATSFLTRFDFVLIFFPAVAWVLARERECRWRRIGWFSLGAAPPVVAWFTWSFMTYSSILPNTFLAKRNLEIPLVELLSRGFHYVTFSFRHDPVTAIVVVVGIVTPFVTKTSVLNRLWSIGVCAYIVYVVQNGGDFMVGRFLSVPFLICLAIIVVALETRLREQPVDVRWYRYSLGGIGLLIASIFVISPPSAFRVDLTEQRWTIGDPDARGIVDERAFYTRRGLSPWTYRRDPLRFEGNVTIGVVNREAQLWPKVDPGLRVPRAVLVECGGLGSYGLNSDPYTHIIDTCGLTDRFVASITYVPSTDTWMPGHFGRTLPGGYEDAIRTSDPSLVDDPSERERLVALWELIRR